MFSEKNNQTTEEIYNILLLLKGPGLTNKQILTIRKEILENQGFKNKIKKYKKGIESIEDGKKIADIFHKDLKLITKAEKEILSSIQDFKEGLELIYKRRTIEQKNNFMFLVNIFIFPLGSLLITYFAYDYIVDFNKQMFDAVKMLSPTTDLTTPFCFNDKFLYIELPIIIFLSLFIIYYIIKKILYRFSPKTYLKLYKGESYKKLMNLFQIITTFEKAGLNLTQTSILIKEDLSCHIDKMLWNMIYCMYFPSSEINIYGITKGFTFSDILIKMNLDTETAIIMKNANNDFGMFYQYIELSFNNLQKKYENFINKKNNLAFLYKQFIFYGFFIIPMFYESYWMSMDFPMAIINIT